MKMRDKLIFALCHDEGLDEMELLEASMSDTLCPGICYNDCGYTTQVEADCDSGYCEECGTRSVVSAVILGGIEGASPEVEAILGAPKREPVKRKTNWEYMAEVDASRIGGAVCEYVRAYMVKPVTVGGMRYPETCAVDVERGRWPDWFKPFVGSVRRIQKKEDPDYGFVTDNYHALTETGYVANTPGDGPYLCKRLKAAAERAGWAVYDTGCSVEFWPKEEQKENA